MTRDELLQKAKSIPAIAQFMPFIEKHIRLAININRQKDSVVNGSVGDSRLGGEPDLAVGVTWPHHEYGPYRFLGQINLEDIALMQDTLPRDGLLSFFVADLYEDFFWQDEHYIKVIYTSKDQPLERLGIPIDYVPEGFVLRRAKQSIPISFEVSWDIPTDEYQVELWPIDGSDPQFYDLYDEFQDAYNEFREQLRTADYGHLFGYPSHNSLGYNPAKTTGNIALLTLDSNDALEWCWHDADFLMTFIHQDHLQQYDFSQIASDAG